MITLCNAAGASILAFRSKKLSVNFGIWMGVGQLGQEVENGLQNQR
jgi:hypothetical protein